jgi:hypothetical protein
VAFLEINGLTVNVLVGSAGEDPPETMGKQRRAFAGNMLSTERTPKLSFTGQIDFWTPEEVDQFLAITCLPTDPLGIPRPVTVTSASDGLTRGKTITAYVRSGRREANVQTVNGVETTWWTLPIAIRQA